MIHRHHDLRNICCLLQISDVISLCLSHREKTIVDALYCQLSSLNFVIIEMQKKSLCVAEAQSFSRGVIKDFSELSRRLFSNFQIIEDIILENALPKIQICAEVKVTKDERWSVQHLTIGVFDEDFRTVSQNISLVEKCFLKKCFKSHASQPIRILNVLFVLQISANSFF